MPIGNYSFDPNLDFDIENITSYPDVLSLSKMFNNALYWSIVQKEDVFFWNFLTQRQENRSKGWLCDIPYEEITPENIITHIKSKYQCGYFDIVLVAQDNKEISRRSIRIAPRILSNPQKIQIGNFYPSDCESSINPALFSINSDNREILSFSPQDNQAAIFTGILRENISEFIDINFFWSTTSWHAADSSWAITFQSVNTDNQTVRENGNVLVKNDKDRVNQSAGLTLPFDGFLAKNTPYKITLSRFGFSPEDHFQGDANVFCVTAESVKAPKNIPVHEYNPIVNQIYSDIYKNYDDLHLDLEIIIKNIVEKFTNCANLKIKGGFVDLTALSEDFDLEQDIVIEIAKSFLNRQNSFLKGKLEIVKYFFNDFGDVYILRRKRFSLF